MTTVLYLVRHGATAANLAWPPRLQGQRSDPPLAPQGICQAETARGLLAACPLGHCYTSPLRRAAQTAAIVAAPHGLLPCPVAALAECDVGRWEGWDWSAIRHLDADAYHRFRLDPETHGYPGGESLADVRRRVGPALAQLITWHADEAVLVVAHQVVFRSYLADLLGLPPGRAREISLTNGSVAVVIAEDKSARVLTLNTTEPLCGPSPERPAA